MSTTIDEKIVELKFNNKDFSKNIQDSLNMLGKFKSSLNFSDSAKSLKSIGDAANGITLNPLIISVQGAQKEFSLLRSVAEGAMEQIGAKIADMGSTIVNGLTLEPVMTGFQEYETQMNAVQTILANTSKEGATIDQVNAALNELNTYADKTIYNFTEMTRNIGTFTAAGVKLDDSVSAIKGIANVAAISGSNAQQASTAMYQLSQALAAGKVTLQDWNSVVNAGMGGQVFQDALVRTSEALGTGAKQAIETYGTFRESLTQGQWLTAEVLTETLNTFTGDMDEMELKAKGYSDEEVKEIMKMGEMANNAATKVKTFTQLWDTVQEAVQSGWTQTWQYIIGDFEEARELLTGVSDILGVYIEQFSNARNEVMKFWHDNGGRAAVIEAISNAFQGFVNMATIAKNVLATMIPPITGKMLVDFSKKLLSLSESFLKATKAMQSGKEQTSAFFSIFKASARIVLLPIKALGSLVYVLSPLAQILTAIPGLIGAILLPVSRTMNWLVILGKQLGLFQGGLKSAHDAVDLFAKGVTTGINQITKALHLISTAIHAFFTAISKSGVKNSLKPFEEIDAAIQKIAKTLFGNSKSGTSIFDAAFKPLENLSRNAGSILAKGFNYMKNEIKGAGTELATFAEGLVGATDKVAFTTAFLKQSISGIEAFVASIPDKLSAKSAVVGKFISSISEAFDRLDFRLNSFGGTGFKNKFNSVLLFFKDIKTSVVEFAKSFEVVKAIQDAVSGPINALKTFKAILVGTFLDSDTYVGRALLSIKSIFDTIKNAFDGLTDYISKAIGTGKLASSALALAGLMAFMIGLKNIIKVATTVAMSGKTVIAGVVNVLKSVSNAVNAYTTLFKSKALVEKSVALRNLAISIGILAASLYVLTTVDQAALKNSAICLGGVVAVFGILAIAISKIDMAGATTALKAMALMIASVGFTMLALAGSLKIIETIDPAAIKDRIRILAGVVAALAVLMIVAGKIAAGKGGSSYTAAANLAAASVALLAMTASLKMLAKEPLEGIQNAINALWNVVAMIAALFAVIKYLGNDEGKDASSMKSFLSMAIGMVAIARAITKIGKLSTDEIQQAMNVIREIMIIFAAITALSSLTKGNTNDVGSGIMKMCTGVLEIAVAIRLLGKMQKDDISKSLGVIFSLLAVLTAIALIMSLGNKQGGNKADGIVKLASGVLILSAAVRMLGGMNPEDIAKAELALMGLALCMGVLSQVGTFAQQNLKSILILTVCIGLLSGVMMLISLLPIEQCIQGTASLAIIMLSLAAVLKATSGVGPKEAASALIMVAAVGAIALVLGLLVKYAGDMDSILKASISIGICIAAVGAAILLLSGVNPALAVQAAVDIAAFMVIVGGIFMAIVEAVSYLAPGITERFNEALLNMSDGLNMISGLDDGVGAKIESIGKAILMIGAAEFLDAISKIANFKSEGGLGALGTSLSEFAENSAGFFATASGMNSANIESIKYMTEAILMLTAAELMDGISNFVGFGKASIGNFGEQLPELAKGLSEFCKATAGIDDSSADKTKKVAKILRTLVAIEVPRSGGFVQMLTGEKDYSAFGKQLKPFATGIVSFCNSVAGLDDDCVKNADTAAKIINKLVSIDIPETAGLLQSLIGGEVNYENFGNQLTPFAEGLVSFSQTITGINEDDIKKAETAFQILNILSSAEFTVGNVSLETVGQNLASLSGGFLGYVENIAGSGADFDTARENTRKLVDIVNILSSVSGDLSGAKSILSTGFGTGDSISDIAKDVVKFAQSISKDEESLRSANASMGNVKRILTAISEFDVSGYNKLSGAGVVVDTSVLKSLAKGVVKYAQEIGENSELLSTAANSTSNIASVINSISSLDLDSIDSGTVEQLTSALPEIGTALSEYSSSVEGISVGNVNSATRAVESLINAMKSMESVDSSSVGNFAESAGKVGETVAKAAEASASSAAKAASSAAASSGKEVISSLTTSISSGLASATKSMSSAGAKLGKAIASGLSSTSKSVASAASNAASSAARAASSHVGSFRSSGYNLGAGLAAGLSAAASGIYAQCNSMIAKMDEVIRKKAQINSPSRLFKRLGAYMTEGFAIGFENGVPRILNSAGHLIDESANELNESRKRIEMLFGETIVPPTIRPVMDLSEMRSGISSINGMLAGVNGEQFTVNGVYGAANGFQARISNDGEIVSAINKLEKAVGESQGNTYNVNGITYDDGTNISTAIEMLIRAAEIERRA